jgi:hypothetical protein
MKPGSRKSLSRWLATAAAFVALSCTDRSTTSPRVIAPGIASRAISDGAHGGNDDVWFLPPMVASPVGQPGYGDAFAAGLPVTIKVVDLSLSNKVLAGVTATTMSLADQLYQANWDTKNTADNNPVGDNYEVQVWIGMTKIAWADANLVSSGSQLKNAAGDVVNLVDGRTLPIKVRIEQGWNCQNNSACVTQVVPATIPSGTTVTVKTNDGKDYLILHGADGTGIWNTGGVSAVVTIEDVSGQMNPPNTPQGCAQSVTRMVVDGHCIKITTDPTIVLATSAVVCMTLPAFQTDWKLLKYNSGETTEFLDDPPAGVCPGAPATIGSASRSSNPLVRLASRVGNTLKDLITPRLAYAFDLGVGGTVSPGDGFSFFAAGRPAQMVKVAGDNQTALAGSVLPIAAQVQILTTHHHSVPIDTATVTCTVTAGNGTLAGGVLSDTATHGPSGIYTCPSWTLGAAGGANTLKVTANLLDTLPANGFATFAATGQTSCVTGCPNPVLALKSVQTLTSGATEYDLTVTNRSQYSDQLFAATPGVMCGENLSASRMFADIYDANGDVFLNGFCALGTAANLDAIYFVVPAGTTPPASVYLLLTDQITHTVYRSNTLSLGNPTITSLTANPASAVIGGGLSNYTVTISNPGGQIPAGGAITGVTNGTNDAVDVQAWIIQGTTKVAANGTVTLCPGQPIGLLPSGTCTFTTSFSASSSLTAGSALLSVDLERQTGGVHTIYDTKTLPITLISQLP